MITIIPAIDLKDGRCVRLRQGVAENAKVYSDDPVAMARHWCDQGACYLHVVDLDGAFQGRPVHSEVVRRIAEAIPIPVEVGGGLRTDEDIRLLLDAGVARAIVGTRALAEPGTLERLVSEFGARLAVGIDARGGMVQIKGWVETTGVRAADLARQAAAAGVKTLIYTDTATDGMLGGTNAVAVDEIAAAVPCDVVASGGISAVSDIVALRELARPNLVGAIVGKALYEKQVSLTALTSATEDAPSA